MSSRKRRVKRKIAMLRRLDATYERLYLLASPRRDGPKSWRLWFGVIIPLGDAIGPRAWAGLDRDSVGAKILQHNYNKRMGTP